MLARPRDRNSKGRRATMPTLQKSNNDSEEGRVFQKRAQSPPPNPPPRHRPVRPSIKRSPHPTPPPRHRPVRPPILRDKAETTIVVSVNMKGELSFERLLRIDGQFKGALSSKGSLIIGRTGQLTGDVKHMKEVVIEGGRIVGG